MIVFLSDSLQKSTIKPTIKPTITVNDQRHSTSHCTIYQSPINYQSTTTTTYTYLSVEEGVGVEVGAPAAGSWVVAAAMVWMA